MDNISAAVGAGLLLGCGCVAIWIFARVRAREVAGEIEGRLARYGGRRI
jgi:hypothetical protein